jgi:hypothetical protein
MDWGFVRFRVAPVLGERSAMFLRIGGQQKPAGENRECGEN